MKTVEKGTNKIDHVEYGDNVVYFYSSKKSNGPTKTEVISRRITGRIMKEYTDEEYNTLLETVIKSSRKILNRTSNNSKGRRSCKSCNNKNRCKGMSSSRACLA